MKARSRPQSRAPLLSVAIMLAVVGIAALAGVVLLITQERSRLSLVAEYDAFRVATLILQYLDADEIPDADALKGVNVFGLYGPDGELLWRNGDAPETLDPGLVGSPPVFSGDSIRIVRLVGGGTISRMRRNRMNMMGSSSAPPAAPEGGDSARRGRLGSDMAPPPPTVGPPSPFAPGRFILIEFESPASIRGQRLVVGVGILVLLALSGAFLLLFTLARRLERYRRDEAKTRELVSLGEAARTLAHEIKNPLGVVKIQCALLRKNGGERIGRNVDVIEEETDRLASLVSKVREFLVSGTGKPEKVELNAFIGSMAERYGDTIETRCETRGLALPVEIDPGRLAQILDNLVANAFDSEAALRKSSPVSEDGAAAKELPVVSLVQNRGEGRRPFARVTVMDRGAGIKDEDLGRLFKPFFTTKATGSGIGLAVARRYAEAAGGSLRYEARKGGGAVFLLDLPIYDGGAVDHDIGSEAVRA